MFGRSDRITDQLAGLATASSLRPDDVSIELTELGAAVRETVSSFAGLHLTTVADGNPVTFTVFETVTDPTDLAASVRVPLQAAVDAATARTVLRLFAHHPGAFVDLAADLTVALGFDPPVTGRAPAPTISDAALRIHLDADLPPWTTVTAIEGLTAFDTVNQAIGVLIERGWSPSEAEPELDRLAAAAGVDLHTQARSVIASI